MLVLGVQKAPCAIQLPHNDANFTTTREEQEERISFIATVTDAMISAQVLEDLRAAKYICTNYPIALCYREHIWLRNAWKVLLFCSPKSQRGAAKL